MGMKSAVAVPVLVVSVGVGVGVGVAACGPSSAPASAPVSAPASAPVSESISAGLTPISTPVAVGSGSALAGSAPAPAASTSLASGPAAASPSPAVSASSPAAAAPEPSNCAAAAKLTYLYVVSARQATGGAIVLTGHRATMVCGGPDDWHFNDATATVTAHVLATAHVQVLTTTNSGIGLKTIKTGQLVSYLPTDEFTKTFQVTGSLSNVSALSEIFHP